MTILLKLNASTQPVECATSSARTCSTGRLARLGKDLSASLRGHCGGKRDRSLASTPDSAELTSATSIRSIS
jgi:hypothetical protein